MSIVPLVYDLYYGYTVKSNFGYLCLFTVQWAVLTIVTHSLCFIATYKGEKASHSLKEWAVFLFFATWALEILNNIAYWGFIRVPLFAKPETPKDWQFVFYLTNIHLVPLFSLTLLYSLSNRLAFVVNRRSLFILFVYSLAYNLHNFIEQQIRGVPVYPFSDWNKPLLAIVALYAINAFIVFIYWGLSKWTLRTQGTSKLTSETRDHLLDEQPNQIN